jgi:hypothetical protein
MWRLTIMDSAILFAERFFGSRCLVNRERRFYSRMTEFFVPGGRLCPVSAPRRRNPQPAPAQRREKMNAVALYRRF